MKRFYENAHVTSAPAGASVCLDGKALRTPKGTQLVVPTRALAQAIADEWNAVEETVNLQALTYTKLSNTALDRGAPLRQQIIEEMTTFAQTDLVCYRAERPARLVALQSKHWDPVLNWMNQKYSIALSSTTALLGHEQSAKALAGVSRVLGDLDAFELTALYTMVGATRSLSIGFARAFGFLDDAQAWAAACVDDHFQMAEWGEDAEAVDALAAKEQDFRAASAFLAAVTGDR